jgi:hypothetical protein
MPLPRFISRVRVTKSAFLLIHDCCQDFVLSRWSDNPYVYAIWSTICTVYIMSLVVYTALESQAGVKILIWLTYWSFYCVALRFVITNFNAWLNILILKNENASPHFYSIQNETVSNATQQHVDNQIVTVNCCSEGSSSEKCLQNAGVEDAGNHVENVPVNTRSRSEQNGNEESVPVIRSGGQTDQEENIPINRNGQTEQEENVPVNRNRQTEQGENSLPARIALQWFLQSISNSVSLIVTVLYWGLIYTGEPQDYNSINSHVITSLLVTGDILMSRAPIRMQHFHIPFTFLTIYITFTVVYWAAGGTNPKGQHFIYSVLDYSTRPGTAAMAICMIALFGIFLIQLYLYFLYRLRNFLYTWKREGVLFYA